MASEPPTGVSPDVVITTLATIEAFGEINNHPRPQLDAILARARAQLEGTPASPPGPPTP